MDPSLPTNQGGEKVQELEQKLAEMRQQAQPQEPMPMAAPQQMTPTYPTTPVVEPTSPPPTLPKSPSTSLPVLIVLFLLVALATVGYYLASTGMVSIPGISPTPTPVSTPTPSPDPTANWKTYTNAKYGFEFKYPQQWEMKPEAVSSNREVTFDTRINTDLQTPEPQTKEFFVMYHKNVTDLTKWLTDNQAGKVVEVKTIGSHQFSVIEGGAMFKSREYAVSLAGNNLLRFVIEPMSTELEDIEQTDEIFGQILSTFKFTDQAVPGLYLNSEHGISFSYPISFKISTEGLDQYGLAVIGSAGSLQAPEPEYYYVLKWTNNSVSQEIQNIIKITPLINTSTAKKTTKNNLELTILTGEVADGPLTGNIIREAYFTNNGKTYILEDSGINKDTKVFNQIIESLKFAN